ncbi:11169_t:CDS:2, partial [Paraglomus occultum]
RIVIASHPVILVSQALVNNIPPQLGATELWPSVSHTTLPVMLSLLDGCLPFVTQKARSGVLKINVLSFIGHSLDTAADAVSCSGERHQCTPSQISCDHPLKRPVIAKRTDDW